MRRLTLPEKIFITLFIVAGVVGFFYFRWYEAEQKRLAECQVMFPLCDTKGFLSPLGSIPLYVDEVKAKEVENVASEVEEVEIDIDDPIQREILEVFKGEYKNAIKIASCESGLRPDAWNENTNGSVDVGVFQINSVHGIRAKWLLNPEVNIRVAKQLFDEQGWNPWVCSRLVDLE